MILFTVRPDTLDWILRGESNPPPGSRIFENNDRQYCGYVQESAIHSIRGNRGKPVMCTRHGPVNTHELRGRMKAPEKQNCITGCNAAGIAVALTPLTRARPAQTLAETDFTEPFFARDPLIPSSFSIPPSLASRFAPLNRANLYHGLSIGRCLRSAASFDRVSSPQKSISSCCYFWPVRWANSDTQNLFNSEMEFG